MLARAHRPRDARSVGARAVERRRILVADDHAATRESLRDDLERGGFAVCAVVGDGVAAVEAALREAPDLCLLDVQMPGRDGTTVAAAIRRALPRTKVLLITAEPDADGALAAARAGADGYLSKEIDPRRLPEVVAAVLAGESAYPRRLLGALLAELRAA